MKLISKGAFKPSKVMFAPIAITCGDPAGIGPEVILKLLCNHVIAEDVVVIGDAQLFSSTAESLGLAIEVIENKTNNYPKDKKYIFMQQVNLNEPVIEGKPNKNNAGYVLKCLEVAMDGCLSGKFSAMVTAPVSKEVINQGGYDFTGHTEFLADRAGIDFPVMLLSSGEMRIALVTTHLPLSAVSQAITAVRLKKIIMQLQESLKKDFAIKSPNIGVFGLNPHAGDGGYLGREELEIISPVIEEFNSSEFSISGPLSADTAFSGENIKKFDVFLAMYHDQGLPVLKYQGFGEAVNITLGLPIVRTSVDHGTAFNLAGTGKASEKSLLMAVQQAAGIIKNRHG